MATVDVLERDQAPACLGGVPEHAWCDRVHEGSDLGLAFLSPHATVIGTQTFDEDRFDARAYTHGDLTVQPAARGVHPEDRAVHSAIDRGLDRLRNFLQTCRSAATTITTWARTVHEHNPHLRPPAGTVRDAAVWLSGWPSLLALHPAADELHADITGLADQIRYRVDRRPDRVYSGPCGAPTDEGPCPGHLYAHAGAAVVACPVCRAGHDVAERREWMTDRARDLLLTAPVALGWARLLLDHAVPSGTWRSWLSRRRFLARDADRVGRPLYRFGDVVDLVADHLRRRHAA